MKKGAGYLEAHYPILPVCTVEHYHNRVGFLLFILFVFLKEGEGVTVKEKREKKGKGLFSFKTEAP